MPSLAAEEKKVRRVEGPGKVTTFKVRVILSPSNDGLFVYGEDDRVRRKFAWGSITPNIRPNIPIKEDIRPSETEIVNRPWMVEPDFPEFLVIQDDDDGGLNLPHVVPRRQRGLRSAHASSPMEMDVGIVTDPSVPPPKWPNPRPPGFNWDWNTIF